MIIGITGLARSGKNTTADVIQALLPRVAVTKLSFAAPIYDMIRASGMFNNAADPFGKGKSIVFKKLGVSPRQALQTLGTEWGREMISENLWRDLTLEKCVDPKMLYIITDVRFRNEAEEIQERGGVIWRIKTPEEHLGWWKNLWRLVQGPVWRRHKSEIEVMLIDPDWVITNEHLGVPRYARVIGDVLRQQPFLIDHQILPELPKNG